MVANTPPLKKARSYGGRANGSVCARISHRRERLVRDKKASWVPLRRYSIDGAFDAAGLT
jgi:hypothetical protein